MAVYSLDLFEPDILTHRGSFAYPLSRPLAVRPSFQHLSRVGRRIVQPLHGGCHTYFSCDIGRGRDPGRAEPGGRGALRQVRVFGDAGGKHVGDGDDLKRL